jgi:hypothetical protein
MHSSERKWSLRFFDINAENMSNLQNVLSYVKYLDHSQCRQEVSIMSRNRISFSIITLILGVFLFTTTLQADPSNNKNKSGKSHNEDSWDKSDFNVDFGLSATITAGIVTAGISIGDARQLASSYGMTGGKPLPKGIRKNLARGKPMPPGIQKTRMPGSFIHDLPYHEGYEWQQAGTDLVLVISGSLVISDILEGVFD